MEEEKKSTDSNNTTKLPWTIVAKAYSVLVALVVDKLPTKTYLPRLNAIVAEAQKTVDDECGWACPQNIYSLIMYRINSIIMDKLIKYSEDSATADECMEMLELRGIRNALDGVNVKTFEYMLTTIVSNSDDAIIPDKLRGYQLALKIVAPDRANAIINDIEMSYVRSVTYLGTQAMSMPWAYTPPSPNVGGATSGQPPVYRQKPQRPQESATTLGEIIEKHFDTLS